MTKKQLERRAKEYRNLLMQLVHSDYPSHFDLKMMIENLDKLLVQEEAQEKK